MKHFYVTRALLAIGIIFFTASITKAQQTPTQTDELINLLIKNKVVTQQDADSLRAELAVKEQERRDKEKQNQHNITIGTKALQISGLVQARFQGYQQKGVYDSFDLHRARLDAKGSLTDQWDYEIYTEFAGGVKLLDAYTTYKIADWLKFSAGQFKIPFSAENLVSDSQLEFIDRSQVIEALASRSKDVIGNSNGRDIGAQVAGSFAKVDGNYLFDYTFGVFNGAGYNVTSDNNNHKDLAARLVIHPVKNLDIGGSWYNGQGVWGTPAKTQTRNRRGVDARYVYGALSLTAEYAHGQDGTIKRNGWFGQAAYFVIPKQLQLAVRYDEYDPNSIIYTDRSTYYQSGVNYFFNSWTKLAVNYSYRREQTTQIRNNVIETQLQVVF